MVTHLGVGGLLDYSAISVLPPFSMRGQPLKIALLGAIHLFPLMLNPFVKRFCHAGKQIRFDKSHYVLFKWPKT